MLYQYKKNKLYNNQNKYKSDVISLITIKSYIYIIELLHKDNTRILNTNVKGYKLLMEVAL